MQLINQPAFKTYLFEVLTGASPSNLYTFPDIPFLRGKKTYAIEAAMCTDSPSGAAPLFQTGVSDPGFVSLVDSDNNQFIQNMPWIEFRTETSMLLNSAPSNLINVYNSSGLLIFGPRIVQFNKCTIYFPAPPTANRSMIFTVYYK